MVFLLLNIRGLVSKMDNVRYLLFDCKDDVDFMCINESFCDETISNDDISLEGFNIERNDRTRSGGGVVLYISDRFRYTRRVEYEYNDLEVICLQVHLQFQKDIFVIGLYRPPSTGADFFDKLHDMLERLHSSVANTREVIILGDTNCDYSVSARTNLGKKLNGVMNSFNLKQIIDSPTRVTATSNTTIDHIFTSSPDTIVQKGSILTSISDHFMVFAIRRKHVKIKRGYNTVAIRSFKKITADDLMKKFAQQILIAAWT